MTGRIPYFSWTLKKVLIAAAVLIVSAVILAVSFVGAIVLGLVLVVSYAVSALGRASGSSGSAVSSEEVFFERSDTLEAERDVDGSYRIDAD